jgi:hypothetical protein
MALSLPIHLGGFSSFQKRLRSLELPMFVNLLGPPPQRPIYRLTQYLGVFLAFSGTRLHSSMRTKANV